MQRQPRAQSTAAVSALFDWSQNHSFPSPASLFLDLIGHSQENLGERLCSDSQPSMGYLELDLLGKALVAYAEHPSTVWDHVDQLLAVEAA
jgi:hypothetical protein